MRHATVPSIVAVLLLLTLFVTPAAGQIPEGWEIVEITNAPNLYDGPPDINDRGTIVFHRAPFPDWSESEIFVYERGTLTQITDDEVQDAFPRINNHGEIVWRRDADGDGTADIVKWHDGKMTVVSAAPYHELGPDINDAGWVAWEGFVNHVGDDDPELFLFDGASIVQITDNELSNQQLRINQIGQIVAARADFFVSPWTSEIMLYDGGAEAQLTTGQGQVQGCHLNDLTQVVWASSQAGVELWENGVTVLVLENNGIIPRLNNAGSITITRWDVEHANTMMWVSQEGVLLQLTDGSQGGQAGEINARGEIAWESGRFPTMNTALFTRPAFVADIDFDGDVDIRDFSVIQQCFGGEAPLSAQCLDADLDRDDDVDMADLQAWVSWVGGPE